METRSSTCKKVAILNEGLSQRPVGLGENKNIVILSVAKDFAVFTLCIEPGAPCLSPWRPAAEDMGFFRRWPIQAIRWLEWGGK
jgi:hypothetical protein